jgi:hypothetical protein
MAKWRNDPKRLRRKEKALIRDIKHLNSLMFAGVSTDHHTRQRLNRMHEELRETQSPTPRRV